MTPTIQLGEVVVSSPESSFGTLRMLLEKQFRVAFQQRRSQNGL